MLRSNDAIVSTPVTSALATRVGLGVVDPVHLAELERTKEQQRIDDHDRPEGRSPPGQLCDSRTLHRVERLEGEDDLGVDEVGNERGHGDSAREIEEARCSRKHGASAPESGTRPARLH